MLGPDHPDTLTMLGILAHWRDEAGDHSGAAATWNWQARAHGETP